jgi:endonuclease/exonuclease/phosphatase (EEP) superfamily protein YafD
MLSLWQRQMAMAISLLVVIPTAALMALALFARLSWVAELATHFRVQYFCLLAGSCLLYLVINQLKLAGAAGTLALVNGLLVGSVYLPAEKVPDGGRTMRAVSVNVLASNRNHEAVLQFVHETHPDFVLFLEVNQRWAEQLHKLDAEYPHSHTFAQEGHFGMAFYSRIPFKKVEVTDPTDGRTSCFVVHFSESGKNWTFLGAHPASPSRARYSDDRNRELMYLANLARSERQPVMLMGDLNITPWSPYFGDLLRESGLCDSRQGQGVQASFPAWYPVVLIPIDHCLASPDITIHERQVGASVGSDHYPIIVDFSLPEK